LKLGWYNGSRPTARCVSGLHRTKRQKLKTLLKRFSACANLGLHIGNRPCFVATTNRWPEQVVFWRNRVSLPGSPANRLRRAGPVIGRAGETQVDCRSLQQLPFWIPALERADTVPVRQK